MRPNVADAGRRGMFGALLVALRIAGVLWSFASAAGPAVQWKARPRGAGFFTQMFAQLGG